MSKNFNVLLRQNILQKRDLSAVAEEKLRMIKGRLNNRPIKGLGFKTTNQVFLESLNPVALRA